AAGRFVHVRVTLLRCARADRADRPAIDLSVLAERIFVALLRFVSCTGVLAEEPAGVFAPIGAAVAEQLVFVRGLEAPLRVHVVIAGGDQRQRVPLAGLID